MATAGDAPTDVVERAYLWTGEFADPHLEGHFREATWSETIERMRAIQLGVYMFACWSVIEYVLFGPTRVFFTLLGLRLLAPAVSRLPPPPRCPAISPRSRSRPGRACPDAGGTAWSKRSTAPTWPRRRPAAYRPCWWT